MTPLAERYTEVKQRVADAAARSGRTAESVYLIAVTKTAEPEDIRELVELGHRDFGENRVQQLVQRASIVEEWYERQKLLSRSAPESAPFDPDKPVRWHMIGHLQRNKARKIAGLTRLVHSVDSLRLAEELQLSANKLDRDVDVLIQVNVSGEESKEGLPVSATAALAEQIDTMVHVHVRGLMTMAPYSENPEDAREYFVRCRELFEELRHEGYGDGRFDLLSMGMSGDYEVAIEEGANLVRVGSAIFGASTEQPVEHADASGL
ncbi:MAG: YggS family pyridoxal phosphate-dependent enzyme [Phycisphaerales bacterium]